MLEEFRSELEERLSPAGVQVIWQTTNTNDRIELPPRHFINIRRVLNEAASNALQHGADAKLCIAIKMVEQHLK
jgi:two-component sensor histidine kinase